MAPEINIFLGSPNLFRMQHINLEGYLARPAGMIRNPLWWIAHPFGAHWRASNTRCYRRHCNQE
jgi:hypothetical protein